jgi:tetratricopeptide (TPR) repeat protein
LETIRQYARERLQESTDVEDTRGQHREFFLQLAERAGAQLSGPQQARWLQRLEMEHDNFQVALDWALSSDVTLCARLAKALWRFWELRGHWKEGLLWLEQCLLETTLPANLRAATLDAAGNLSSLQGNYARAKTLFEEQLTLEQQLGDQRGVADALHNLMSVAWKHGDYETARKIEEHCLSIRRTLGDKSAIAGSLVALGTFAHEQGDYQRAGELYGEALALRRELGDESSIATLLNNMGNLAQAQGKTEQGRKLQEESLAIRRKVGDKAGIAQTLLNLAVLAQEQGEFARAQKLLDESLGIDRELGNKKGIAFSLRNYGELMQLQRDFKKAFGYYQQSVELFRELDDKLGVTACMEGFAVLAVLQNHVDRAARLFGAAEALRGVVGTNVPVSFESTEYNSRLATVRAELSDEAFAVASTEGQAMSVAEAISYALSKPEMNGNQ